MGARRNSVISKSWLQERQEILQKIKDQVRLYLGAESPDISDYANAYKADLARPWQPTGWQELFVALEQVQVVFGGDFHPFAQAQRTHLRILRRLIHEHRVVLALECLFVEDQEFVNLYLKGQMGEDEFLSKIQWEQRWGFPWSHYKPLFEFAKKNGVSLMALNQPVDERTATTLHSRDHWAAEVLHGALKQDPESLYYVIYGDLHVAGNHLPDSFKRLLKPEPKIETATLFLNSESIYFSLAQAGKENEVEVVQFNDREFCILSSPPWVKWHSYLMYLEENFDVDLEFDDMDEDEDDEEWDFTVDHTDHVSDLVKMICAAIDVQMKTDAIEVYSLKDPQAIVVSRNSLNPEEFDLAHDLIQSDQSYYIPHEGFFYLSKSTVNHAASLAGQFIHRQLCNQNKVFWDYPNDFISTIWMESMSFLLSKFVNPKRKAQTMADLKKQLEAFHKSDQGREPLLLALDQKMLELLKVYAGDKRTQVFAPRKKSSYALAAKFIGEIMGNRYFMLYEKQILDIDSIRALLRKDLGSEDFLNFYFDQLKRLDQLEIEGG